MTETEHVGMFEFVEAVESAIAAAPAEKRKALAETIEAFSEHDPETFFWAIGPQAPALLWHLVSSIDIGSQSHAESKPGRVIRLIDRKPEGNA